MEVFNLDNFNPNSNYVIEASAGTGKTYNIVEIVKKLFGFKYDNEKELSLNDILIVTYTEKAAGELKNRIREELKSTNVDDAPICTIHSFCQNVIKEFGLSANLPLKLNVIDDKLIEEFAEVYVRKGKILADISELLEVGIDVNVDKVIEILVAAVKKYYLNSDFQEDQSIIILKEINDAEKILKEKIKIRKCETFDEVFKLFSDFEGHYEAIRDSGNNKLNELADKIVSGYKDFFNYEGKYQGNKKMSNEEKEALKYFQGLKGRYKLSEEYALASLYLKDFYISWQKEKENNKNQDFDDMIRFVREAILRDDKLKKRLQDKYKIAIIDEFQDTNQRQFDIFSNIFMEDKEHRIIVVGDPKQSIYSFQGADINVYHNALEKIIANGGKKCMLVKNFRSTENMVKSCNKLFQNYNFDRTIFEDCGSLTSNDDEYHEVSFDGKPTKAFWIAKGEDGETINESDFADIAVQQILRCCSKGADGETRLKVRDKKSVEFREVNFNDFVVLARTSSEMVDIQRALKNAGIPYIRYKDKSLFLGRECAHWIAVLKAINTPDFTGRNRKILKRALFTNFFGLTLETISSEYVNKDNIKEIELINKWKVHAINNRWEDLFDDIINNSDLTKNMKSLKEIQSISIFKQIANYAVEYLSKGKSMNELIRHLSNLSKKSSDSSDEQNGGIVEKSTNFYCVRIMTIHASKGLQFSVVISACGFKEHKNMMKLYNFHNKDSDGSEKQFLTFEDEKVGDESISKLERIAEWKRLFYVAYTRAQFLSIMPYYEKYSDKFLKGSLEKYMNDNPDDYETVYNNGLSYDELRVMTSNILGKPANQEEVAKLKENQNKEIIKLKGISSNIRTHKHSYSSLTHGHEHKQEVDEEENKEGTINEGLSSFDKLGVNVALDYDEKIEPIILSKDYPKGAKLGTALHEIFENLDFKNYQKGLDEKIKSCFLKQGIMMKDEWLSETKQIVENVLLAKISKIKGSNNLNETFRLAEIPFENKNDEMEFNFNFYDSDLRDYCNGFVDMVFKQGDCYSIVDWKSDKLNDDFTSYSNKDSLKKHVDDCYSIQRTLYSYCLIKWLKMYYDKLTESQIFDNYFGGIYYIFLRGCNKDTSNGIYAHTWSCWDDLLKSFEEIKEARLGGK